MAFTPKSWSVYNASRPDVVPVHEAWGTHVTARGRPNNPGDRSGFAPAGLFSTAPYRPDDDPSRHGPVRAKGREKKCKANDDTCRAWATKKYDYQYCNPHGAKAEGKAPFPTSKERYDNAIVSDG